VPGTKPGRIEARFSSLNFPWQRFRNAGVVPTFASTNRVNFKGIAVTVHTPPGPALEDISDNEGK
jgi:hypothetical protein